MIQFFHRIPSSKLVTSRESYIIDICRGKRVLHIGCVDAGMTDHRIAQDELLHKKILDVANYTVGVDVSSEGIRKLKERGINNLYAVAPDDPSPLNEKFDIVVAGEVLEHVSNAGDFLRKYIQNLHPDGLFLITVPNAFCLTTIIRLLRGIETVHEDHVSYYSYLTLKRLLSRVNLIPESHAFYFHNRGNGLIKLLKTPLNFFIKTWPQFGEGIIFLSRIDKVNSK